MTTLELIKELGDAVSGAISKAFEKIEGIEKRVEPVEQFLKDFEPFDPSNLEEKIEEVRKAIPELPEPFDPSSIEEKIEEVRKAIPELPEPFDPSSIEEKIEEVSNRVIEDTDISLRFEDFDKKFEKKIEEVKKAYVDELQKQIDGVCEVYQKEIAEIKKELEAPIKVEVPTAKQYDGSVVEKGSMILHNNNLYVNLLDGNDSEPSEVNKSYKLLIKAPKAPVHKGVYNKDTNYEFNDMVMWENSTWIKTEHPSNDIPSEGWKLVAKAVRGKPGRKGDQGDVTVVDNSETIELLQDEIAILKGELDAINKA